MLRNCTHHLRTHDIATTEAVANLDAIFFCGTHILHTDNTRKILPGWQRDAVDNGDGNESLERRKTGDCADNDGTRSGWVGLSARYGECVGCWI